MTGIVVLGVTSLVAGQPSNVSPAASPNAPTSRPRRQVPPPASPQEIARLAEQGKRDALSHDPSTIQRDGDIYWMFCTGYGVESWHSRDLRTWERGPRVFRNDTKPKWIARTVPAHTRMHFWAPDAIRAADGSWLLFYSVSTFGKQTSGIGVARNATLNPNDPRFRWQDEGLVIASSEQADFNAIDPAMFRDDATGQLWMALGSFWSGLKLVELDPQTGKRIDASVPPIPIAQKREGIEAAYLTKHDARYYLFVNWGFCCRGVNSTYEIRVGRSDRVEGPYVDRDGKPLLDGGGTPVLASDGKFIGPGHAGIVTDAAGKQWLSCHFYDGTENGAAHLGLRPLTWHADGWPVAGEEKR